MFLLKLVCLGYRFDLLCCRIPLEIIQIVACQYRDTLIDEEMNSINWNTKVNYLKRNPVTVAKQIDHIFQ